MGICWIYRKQICIFLSFIVFTVCSVGFASNEKNVTTIGASPNFGGLFPANENFYGEASQFGGKVTALVNNSFEVDKSSGDIMISFLSKEFEYRGRFDNSFKLKNSVFTFKSKDLIKLVGHDKRVTNAEQSQKLMSIKYYLNDRQKDVKMITCDANTVDSDILLFYLQGKLLEGNEKFNITLISKGSGMKVNAAFRLTTASDFLKLSPEYEFPADLKKISGESPERYVYVMELSGVAKIFFPYKYYYVYDKENPHSLIAYWGGPVKNGEYAYKLTE